MGSLRVNNLPDGFVLEADAPDWQDYEHKAQAYLSRPVFKGTPLNGKILAAAAQSAYQETGVIVPLELSLSQAQFETGMGRVGRNPSTNPYNVGEYDEGTKIKFKDIQEGVNSYYRLMAKDYLPGRTVEDLTKNFVNKAGKRYASNPKYEKLIKSQVNFIRGFTAKVKKPAAVSPLSMMSDMNPFSVKEAQADELTPQQAADLPEGFVLDEAPAPKDTGVPEGFVLDDGRTPMGERLAKGFGMGVAASIKGTGTGIQLAADSAPPMIGTPSLPGIPDAMKINLKQVAKIIGKQAENLGRSREEFYKIDDPDFAYNLASGFGSMGTFIIPGMGSAKAVQALAAAPKIAKIAGATAMGAFESMTEAGSTYERAKQKGMDEEGARAAATADFWINMPITTVLNKLGIFGEKAGLVKSRLAKIKEVGIEALRGGTTEGIQEAAQQVAGNVAVSDPTGDGVVQSALIGFITGGIFNSLAAVDEVGVEKKAKEDRQEANIPDLQKGKIAVKEVDARPEEGKESNQASPVGQVSQQAEVKEPGQELIPKQKETPDYVIKWRNMKLERQIAESAEKSAPEGESLQAGIARTKDWITGTLKNDEASTDAELVDYFKTEGGFSQDVAEHIVSKRNKALSMGLPVSEVDTLPKKTPKAAIEPGVAKMGDVEVPTTRLYENVDEAYSATKDEGWNQVAALWEENLKDDYHVNKVAEGIKEGKEYRLIKFVSRPDKKGRYKDYSGKLQTKPVYTYWLQERPAKATSTAKEPQNTSSQVVLEKVFKSPGGGNVSVKITSGRGVPEHFELKGDDISETGYQSHFAPIGDKFGKTYDENNVQEIVDHYYKKNAPFIAEKKKAAEKPSKDSKKSVAKKDEFAPGFWRVGGMDDRIGKDLGYETDKDGNDVVRLLFPDGTQEVFGPHSLFPAKRSEVASAAPKNKELPVRQGPTSQFLGKGYLKDVKKAYRSRVKELGNKMSAEEQSAWDFVIKKPAQMLESYLERIKKEYKTDFQRIISADSAKHAIPGFDVKRSGHYHEPASTFVKHLFSRLLEDPSTKDSPVLFMGGIAGAGKTHNLRAAYGDEINNYALVYDTNLNSIGSLQQKSDIIQARNKDLDGKREVEIFYVYREPIDAWREVMARAMIEGRIVPIPNFVDTAKSIDAIKIIHSAYPSVVIKAMDNTGRMGKQISVDGIPALGYTLDGLKEAVVKETEAYYESKRITKDIRDAAIGDEGTRSVESIAGKPREVRGEAREDVLPPEGNKQPEESRQQEVAPTPSPNPPSDRISKLVKFFDDILQNGESLPKKPLELLKLAQTAVDGSQKEIYDEVYDAAEMALNKNFRIQFQLSGGNIDRVIGDARRAEEILPLRGRSLETIKRQQFSTPLPLSAAANYLMDIQPGETVLEPTAGTGNLIVPWWNGKWNIVANEIDARRLSVLRNSGIEMKITDQDFLKYDGPTPDAIISNPPFGALQTGRYQSFAADYRATNIDQRFINKMIRILPEGGRIVVVTSDGTGTGVSGAGFRKWVAKNHTLLAVLSSPEGAYKYRGSPTVKTAIFVIEKGKRRGDVSPLLLPYESVSVEGDQNANWNKYVDVLKQIREKFPRLTPGEKSAIPKMEVKPDEKVRSATDETPGGREPGRGETARVSTSGDQGGTRAGRDEGVVNQPENRPPVVREEQPRSGEVSREVGSGSPDGGTKSSLTPAQDRKRIGKFVYTPRTNTLSVKGSPHPGGVVESEELAVVPYPKITYQPHDILLDAYKRGTLSDQQADVSLLAAQSLDSGKGFLIADDVGVGKTREMAAIIAEALESGKKNRVLYVTKSDQILDEHLETDFSEVMTGEKEKKLPFPVVRLDKIPNLSENTDKIPLIDKAIYTTTRYRLVEHYQAYKDLGIDLMVIDEAHQFGSEDPKQKTNIAWHLLHNYIPGPAVYATATPGKDLTELGYLYGLKLWNKNTFDNFIEKATGQRVGKKTFFSPSASTFSSSTSIPLAQQVMRELKMRGQYASRDIPRGGVEFIVFKLPFNEQDIADYNKYTAFLKKAYYVGLKYAKFNKVKGGGTLGIVKSMMQFAAKRHQVDLKIQRLVPFIKKDIEDGYRVFIATDGLNKLEEAAEESAILKKVDISKGYVRAVIDGINDQSVEKIEGEVVADKIPEAIEEKALLIDEMKELPKQLSIEEFVDEQFKDYKVVYYTGNTSTSNRKKALKAWMEGDADILLGSTAAKTGISAHDKIGKRIRMYYIDIDFDVTTFKQALGRVNRTGEKTSPVIALANVGGAGERKFLATVAARMKNLGATSKGQAESGVVDFLSEFDIEGGIAHQAARDTYDSLPDEDKELFLNKHLKRTMGDGSFGIMYSAPGKYYVDDFLYDLNFIEYLKANEFLSKFIEKYKEIVKDSEVLFELKAERLSGTKLRELELYRDPVENDFVTLHEVVDKANNRFGIVTGMLTDKMKRLKELGAKNFVKFMAGDEAISGLKVLPSDIPIMAKNFGKSMQSMVTKENAFEVVRSGDKVSLVKDLVLYKRQDLNVGIREAKMKDKVALQAAGAKYSSLGSGSWYLDPTDEAVQKFIESFPLVEPKSKEEIAREKLEKEPIPVETPSIGLSTRNVGEDFLGEETNTPLVEPRRPAFSGSDLDGVLRIPRAVHDFLWTFGKQKRLDPALYNKLMEGYNALSARVENAIIQASQIIGKDLSSVDRADITFALEEKDYTPSAHLNEKVAALREVRDGLERELKENEVFKMGFIERKMAELEEEKIRLESAIETLEENAPQSRRLATYQEKLREVLEQIEQVSNLEYLTHRGVAKAAIEQKLSRLNGKEKEVFLSSVRRISYKYKKRIGITPLRVLYDSGLLSKHDVDIFNIMSQMLSEAQFRLTMKGIFDFLKENGYLIHKNTKEVPSVFVRYNPITTGMIAPEYENYWIHPIAMDGLMEIKRGLTHSGGIVKGIFNAVKTGQFYNPSIIWRYNVLQMAFSGALGIKTPYQVAKGIKENWVKGSDYQEANHMGLFQKAYLPVIGSRTESDMIKLAARQTLKDLPMATKIMENVLGMTMTTEDSAQILWAAYRAISRLTWEGDNAMRLATMYAFEGMGYSRKEAVDMAAQAGGAYSEISPRSRELMSYVFFVYSFRILMPRFMWRVIYEPVKKTAEAIGGKRIPGRDWVRMAKALSALIFIPIMWDWYMKHKGFKAEVPFWKYYKNVGDKEVVQNIDFIANQPVKWLARLAKADPLNPAPALIQGLKSYGKWEIHPVWRLLFDVNDNRKSLGYGEIYNKGDRDDVKLLKSAAYMFKESFRLIPLLFPETDVSEPSVITPEDKRRAIGEAYSAMEQFAIGLWGNSYVRQNRGKYYKYLGDRLDREMSKRMRYSKSDHEREIYREWYKRTKALFEEKSRQ